MLFPSLPSQPMDYFENLYYRKGFQKIAGVDEVGRGPLAGPVVAAAGHDGAVLAERADG